VIFFLQNWYNEVGFTSDGRLFKHIKCEFDCESYLNLNNRALRVSITKIRLSSHLFLVERGRWGVKCKERRECFCTLWMCRR